jgi:hypothetical protein
MHICILIARDALAQCITGGDIPPSQRGIDQASSLIGSSREASSAKMIFHQAER